MMYHFEVNKGESPDFAIVNTAPSEPYVGLPLGVKALEEPCVKSMVVDFPRAGSGGHEPEEVLATYITRRGSSTYLM
jgi:hypothetical protein